MSDTYIKNFESPLGNIVLVSDKKAILKCSFKEKKAESENVPEILDQALIQLHEYFIGKRKKFNLRLSNIGTAFQNKVWNEVLKIPFGKTITYKELAQRVGNSKATRAVGKANGQNPISIIIPCHRVIGSDGNLVGYGGGIERKKWLLDFEKGI